MKPNLPPRPVSPHPRPPRRRRPFRALGLAATAAAALFLTARPLAAQVLTVSQLGPDRDKWNYPFASGGGGARTSGPTFGAVGTAGFDNRDGQFYTSFNTVAAGVPAGLGAGSYQVVSARLTLQIANGGTFSYDRTYDPRATYDPATGAPVNDADAGRPMELYGAGFRNGFTSATYLENSAFSASAGPAAGVRSAFATDNAGGSARDVSNNVTAGFDPSPFAIGQVAGLAPGDTVPTGAFVVFDLNLSNLDVLAFLQGNLNDGRVSLMTTSLHLATFGGAAAYPDYFTKENLLGGLPGQLDLTVNIVPEPGTWALLAAGGIALAGVRAGRRRAVRPQGRKLRAAGGFTLVELLVVVTIIGLLAGLALPVLRAAQNSGRSTRETAALRQVMVAYHAYAAEHDNQVLPGYGDFPATDANGVPLGNPINRRYPWRLAPYFAYDFRALYVNENAPRLAAFGDPATAGPGFAYSVSIAPSFGINATFVGGDWQTLPPDNAFAQNRYGADFCVTRLNRASNLSRLVVFTSARSNLSDQETPGYYQVTPPNLTSRQWDKTFNPARPSEAYGHVAFRHGGQRAAAAMLDGHVELLAFNELNDMRRWSPQADRADWMLGNASQP